MKKSKSTKELRNSSVDKGIQDKTTQALEALEGIKNSSREHTFDKSASVTFDNPERSFRKLNSAYQPILGKKRP